MNKPKISLIVAMDLNRGIGKDNGLLWHISEELKRFKEITTGHPIIMGRKTFESIGRSLPNRTNIVITRDQNFKAEGCIVVNSLEEAIKSASSVNSAPDQVRGKHPAGIQRSPTKPALSLSNVSGMTEKSLEIFIIGGGQIYEQAMQSGIVDKLYLTIVEESPSTSLRTGFDATVFFPDFSEFKKVVSESEIQAEGTTSGNLKTFKIKFLQLERSL